MANHLKSALLAVPILLASISAYAQLGSEYDIAAFCDPKAPRQTVIYVDDMVLVEDDLRFGEQILAKLRGNLMPSEPVSVVKISPATGDYGEVWRACYPDYTDADRRKLQDRGLLDTLIKSDPLKVLEKQQAFFLNQLGGAVTRIVKEGGRSASAVKVDPTEPPLKQIIRSLAHDEARFDRSRGALRVLIYSDMLENSDLGKATAGDRAAARKAARSFNLNFQNATVYAFGVGSTLPERGIDVQAAERFWDAFFASASAFQVAFSNELAISAAPPVASHHFEVTVSAPDGPRTGRMQLFVDRDGQLQDSFLTAGSDGRSYIRKGRLVCRSTDCTLTGEAPNNIILVGASASEVIKLTGSPETMKGTIGVPNATVLDDEGAETDAMFPLAVDAAY